METVKEENEKGNKLTACGRTYVQIAGSDKDECGKKNDGIRRGSSG